VRGSAKRYGGGGGKIRREEKGVGGRMRDWGTAGKAGGTRVGRDAK